MKKQTFSVTGDYIRLDDLLKVTGYVTTGGQAKLMIQNGAVLVDGAVCTQRGKKLRGGETVTVPAADGEILLARP